MIKIGILSDIHGDSASLEKALALLKSQSVNQIICAGDLIDRGGDDDGVIARIRAENIPTVCGNHDHRAKRVSQRMMQNSEYRERLLRSGMGLSLLSPEAIEYLSALPKTLNFDCEGIRILMAHGSPTHYDTYIFPNAMPTIIRGIAKNADADVVILGHTHVPMILNVNNTLIINPGSVYHNYENTAERTCGILSLPSCEFTLWNIDTEKTVPLTIRQI